MDKTILCQVCGTETECRSKQQKYCPSCSEIRNAQRQNKWAREHPATIEKRKQYGEATKSRLIKKGITISKDVSKKSLLETEYFTQDNGWCVKFTFPYSQAASKNHLWSLSKGGGHLFKRKEVRQYQEVLALKIKAALSGVRIFNNKIWIELFVQKPNHRSDAINILDTVCDAIKVGIGVDDRWFSIRQLDWEITKTDPQIFVSVYQRDVFDAQACSHCGRILPLQVFTKNKTNKNGFARVCRDCISRKEIPPSNAELRKPLPWEQD